MERLLKPLHVSVRRALRQAWGRDDADKAERRLRNLHQEAPSVTFIPWFSLTVCWQCIDQIARMH